MSADAGLPVPAGTPCIDLALTRGVPSFDQVTLRCAPIAWPCTKERTFSREELVRLDTDGSDECQRGMV